MVIMIEVKKIWLYAYVNFSFRTRIFFLFLFNLYTLLLELPLLLSSALYVCYYTLYSLPHTYLRLIVLYLNVRRESVELLPQNLNFDQNVYMKVCTFVIEVFGREYYSYYSYSSYFYYSVLSLLISVSLPSDTSYLCSENLDTLPKHQSRCQSLQGIC